MCHFCPVVQWYDEWPVKNLHVGIDILNRHGIYYVFRDDVVHYNTRLLWGSYSQRSFFILLGVGRVNFVCGEFLERDTNLHCKDIWHCVLEYEAESIHGNKRYAWWRHGIRNTRMLESRGQARSHRSWRVVGVSAQKNGRRDRIRPAIPLLRRYFSLDRNLGYRDTVFMIVLISVTATLRHLSPFTTPNSETWTFYDPSRLYHRLRLHSHWRIRDWGGGGGLGALQPPMGCSEKRKNRQNPCYLVRCGRVPPPL